MGEPILPEILAFWAAVFLAVATTVMLTISALVERSGPIRLYHWAEKTGGRLLQLYETPRRFEAFRFLLTLSARLTPLAMAWALGDLLLTRKVAAAAPIALAVVAVLLVLLEWANRSLVEVHSEDALRLATGLLRLLQQIFWPATWLLAGLVVPSESEEEDEDDASDDEIDAYIDVGRREGILEPEEEEMVRSIVDFGDTLVRSVMTPRVEIVSAPADASPEELSQRFFESKHARIPLFRESIDEVVGILHIRDLFETIHSSRDGTPEGLAHPPLYVPETKPLRQLLEEMQTLHQQMAIVVDEYGGVAGLVTVEDLVEEIVGEISDEHEMTRDDARVALGEDGWRLAGRAELEDLEELFGIDPDELPYETVSGMICGELGYVPKIGDSFALKGLHFVVEDGDERRIIAVAIRREKQKETA
jgi:CBS domain containing-hemolysin-like protein